MCSVLRVAGCGLRVTGCGLRGASKKGIAHRVRHRLLEGAEGSKELRE